MEVHWLESKGYLDFHCCLHNYQKHFKLELELQHHLFLLLHHLKAFLAANYQYVQLQIVWQIEFVQSFAKRWIAELVRLEGSHQTGHDCHIVDHLYNPPSWSEFDNATAWFVVVHLSLLHLLTEKIKVLDQKRY